MPSSTSENNGCLKNDANIKPSNSLNVKKSLSLFSTFRGFTKKSHKVSLDFVYTSSYKLFFYRLQIKSKMLIKIKTNILSSFQLWKFCQNFVLPKTKSFTN